MIYVYIYGRLGNILFQIAQAIALADKHSIQFAGAYPLEYWCNEPDNCYLRTYLNQFKDTILRNVPILDSLPTGLVEIRTKEQFLTYDGKKKIILNLYNFPSLMIDSSYFPVNLIQSFFQIDSENLNYLKIKYPELFSKTNSTSITIRRGDYLKNSDSYSICTFSYYSRALSEFPESDLFLIISDDEGWCKKHFIGDKFLIVKDEPPIIDFYLQTFCKNNIISNSTFAWWGAFLDSNMEKKVIAPWPWYGIGIKKKINYSDILPQTWITVANKSTYWQLRGILSFVYKRLITLIKAII